jgi:hypothetical protein
MERGRALILPTAIARPFFYEENITTPGRKCSLYVCGRRDQPHCHSELGPSPLTYRLVAYRGMFTLLIRGYIEK